MNELTSTRSIAQHLQNLNFYAFPKDLSHLTDNNDFHQFRLDIIDLLDKELILFFKSNHKIEVMLHILDYAAFKFFDKIKAKMESSPHYSLEPHFFEILCCSLRLFLKYENVEEQNYSLTSEIYKNYGKRINLAIQSKIEIILLDKLGWGVNTYTMISFAQVIINELIENETSSMGILKKDILSCCEDYILYIITNLKLCSNYTKAILCITVVSLSLRHYESEFYFGKMINILKESDANSTYNIEEMIESCEIDIISALSLFSDNPIFSSGKNLHDLSSDYCSPEKKKKLDEFEAVSDCYLTKAVQDDELLETIVDDDLIQKYNSINSNNKVCSVNSTNDYSRMSSGNNIHEASLIADCPCFRSNCKILGHSTVKEKKTSCYLELPYKFSERRRKSMDENLLITREVDFKVVFSVHSPNVKRGSCFEIASFKKKMKEAKRSLSLVKIDRGNTNSDWSNTKKTPRITSKTYLKD